MKTENGKLKKYKLGELFKEFHAGKNIKSQDIFEQEEFPVFGGNGVRGFTKSYNQDGDYIIIGRQGAYCGNVRYNSGKAYLTEHAIIGKPTNNNNSIYLAYKLSLINLSQFQGQSAQPGLSVETLSNIVISVPEKNKQDSIAKLLKILDDKIALNRRMNAKLEQMAKRLYEHWFVQFDFPNADGKPYKASGGKMVCIETLKREIPAGWEVIQIKDIATLERGISYSKENLVDAGTPMISLASFSPDSSYKENCIKYYQGDIDSCDYLNPYDVLMCTTQQTDIDNVTDIIGKCIVVPDVFREQAVFTTDLVKVKVEQNLGLIISCETKLPWYNKYITGFASGTSIKHLNTAGFLNYSIALPKDVDIINKFANIIMNFKRQQSVIMKETQKLTALRDRLLPLLMNGQVEVK